ncbi:DUF7266 family protein [Halosimplex sp. J119]
MGDRGVTPAVGKTLEIGIVVLFIGLLTTALLGNVVPGYRTATGAEVSDRVLATAGQEIEHAIPPAAREVSVRTAIDLPNSIAGASYVLRIDGQTLVLDHPTESLSGRLRLSVPSRVDRIEGRSESGAQTIVAIRSDSDELVVELGDGEPR